MFKACPKCGNIHEFGYRCKVQTASLPKTKEAKLRSSGAWKRKAIEVKKKALYLCEVCKSKNIFNYRNLEVHHIVKLKDKPSLMLANANLVCLCSEHHKMADAGEIGADFLKTLASKREEQFNTPPMLY